MPNYFDEANRLGRDQAEGFFSFKAVGDKIGGEIIDMFYAPARGVYKEQRCFTLKQEDGKIMNVGIKYTEYNLLRTDNLQSGDQIGILFEREIPPKTPGLNPTKVISLFPKELGPRIVGKQAKDLAVPSNRSVSRTAADDEYDSINSTPPAAMDDELPFPNETPSPASSGASIDAIRALARSKGLVPADVQDPEAIDALIVSYAGMPLVSENNTKIIIKLTAFSK